MGRRQHSAHCPMLYQNSGRDRQQQQRAEPFSRRF
jgi:hypothetical protein